MTFPTRLLRLPTDPLGWNGRLLIPAEAVAAIGHDGKRRYVIRVEGMPAWHGALTSDGDGGHYVIFSKERQRALEAADLDPERLTVHLEVDDSRYGAPMPEEFAAVLAEDALANAYFHELTPGRQRNVLYLIGRYKTSDTRLRKAVAIAEYLAEARGQLDSKELGEWMRGR